MSNLQYQRYGVTIPDFSKAMQAGIESQQANVKGVIEGIQGLVTRQENQAKQQTTFGVQEYLRNRLQQGGLNTALTNPVDREELLARYGDGIDMAAIDKTVAAQTNLLKSRSVASAADDASPVFRETGSPLKTADAFTNSLRKGGATQEFIDEQLPAYMAKKAIEAAHVEAQFQQGLEETSANMLAAARQRGYEYAKSSAPEYVKGLPAYLQRRAIKTLNSNLDTAGTPNKFDDDGVTSALQEWDVESRAIENLRKENLKQKNEQTSSVSSSNSMSEGTSPAKASTHGTKGKSTGGAVEAFGARVTNLLEKLSTTNDGAELIKRRSTLMEKGIDASTADGMVDEAIKSVYPGDSIYGNNLTKGHFKKIDTRLTEMVAGMADTAGGEGGRTSSTKSYTRSGNVSFTSADAEAARIAGRAKLRVEYEARLRAAARDRALGYEKAESIDAIRNKYIGSLSATDKPKEEPIRKSATPAARITTKTVQTTPAAKQPGTENADARIARQLKIIQNREVANANAAASKKREATPTPTSAPKSALEQHNQGIRDRQAFYDNISNRPKPAPAPVNPRADKVEVIDPKHGRVWVDKSEAIKRYGYKG